MDNNHKKTKENFFQQTVDLFIFVHMLLSVFYFIALLSCRFDI